MINRSELKSKVLSQIKPSPEEKLKVDKTTTSFLTRLNSKLKDAAGIMGGSGAKDTWLTGSHDVDIFVQFDYKKYVSKNNDLSEILEGALKKAFPKERIERLHGSRDYFQLRFENIDFEIIPILKVSKPEESKNITDLSPLHSIWVNKNTKNIKDEIRLAKQFCKANRIYGAESYIGGFSGYVLEILVAYYGSFEKLLQASINWKDKEVVDPQKHYPKKDALFNLNSSKQQSPLILIDPTDKNRNAAAALSKNAWLELKKIAKEYLKSPSEKFFQKEILSFENLKKEAKKDHLLFLEVKTAEGKEDVIGAQLVKGFEFIKEKIKKFELKKSGWEWDKKEDALLYFILQNASLPEFEIRAGPPLALKEHLENFKKEHKDVYEEKGKIYAKIANKERDLKPYLKLVLKEKYLKDKIKKIVLV